MYQASFLIAAGSCLIMALAGVAMFILSQTLAQKRHARLWALSFAVFTVERALVALVDIGPESVLWITLVNIATVIALFLYLAGFKERRDQLSVPLLAAGAVSVLAVQVILTLTAPVPLSRAFGASIRVVIYVMAASQVTLNDRRSSVTERSVVGILIAQATANLLLIIAALSRHYGLVPDDTFSHAVIVLGTPSYAAIGLFTLALIASDFSRERLRLIQTDPLTGVLNRLGFEQAAQTAIRRARPPRQPLSLVLADIDRFKAVNDRYGHLTGDAALASFARYLIDALPWPTLVGRFGGEEFALLIEGRDGAEVAAQADLARARLSQLAVPGNREVALTASFGVAELLRGETLNDLYARADAALYLSKEEGRDRVSIDPGRAI